MARLALENSGNEFMILGESIPGKGWPLLRLLILAIIMTLWFGISWGQRSVETTSSRMKLNRRLILLPCSYLLIAGLLGQRLWAHHFSVFVALIYFLFAISFDGLFGKRHLLFKSNRIFALRHGFVAICLLLPIMGNLEQQREFYKRLDQTGGVKKASNALTTLAEQAKVTNRRAIYLFPEWGFFMPFAFLTENKIPYSLDVSIDYIKGFHDKYDEVYLAFWEIKDQEKYELLFKQTGFEKINISVMQQLNGQPAFYMIKAEP
jgi:hypothetical protein